MFPSMSAMGLVCVEKTKTSGPSLFPCGSSLLNSALRQTLSPTWKFLCVFQKRGACLWDKACGLPLLPLATICIPGRHLGMAALQPLCQPALFSLPRVHFSYIFFSK